MQIRFKLREGVGRFVERPPWKIEWGGGSSVENPHFQRVHYCELLVMAPCPHCLTCRIVHLMRIWIRL